MTDKLLQFIRDNPRSSFCEIEHFLDKQGYDYHGEHGIFSRWNTLVWDGWSTEAANIISAMLADGKIKGQVATPLETLLMGRAYPYPIAKKPEHDYKDVHWLPLVLSAKQ